MNEPGLRKVLKRYAEFEGHKVLEASDGIEAIEVFKENEIDIIIMDIMMPRLDGFSAVKEIRKISDIPIIMLSARGEEYDKVLGFELGIDDYVVKPFSSKEVMLRVNAILKRVDKSKSKMDKINNKNIFEREGLKADLSAYKVLVDGKEVSMAPKTLMELLLRHRCYIICLGDPF